MDVSRRIRAAPPPCGNVLQRARCALPLPGQLRLLVSLVDLVRAFRVRSAFRVRAFRFARSGFSLGIKLALPPHKRAFPT